MDGIRSFEACDLTLTIVVAPGGLKPPSVVPLDEKAADGVVIVVAVLLVGQGVCELAFGS